MIEARIEGLKPVVINHRAETMHAAVDEAVSKLLQLIEDSRDKLPLHKRHRADFSF